MWIKNNNRTVYSQNMVQAVILCEERKGRRNYETGAAGADHQACGYGFLGIPRTSLGDSKINIGMIQGGSGRNVICDRVKLVMELRGHNQAALGYIYPYARKSIEHSAAMHGCTSEIKLMGETYSLLSDVPEFVDEIVAFSKSMGFRTTGPKKGDASDDDSTMCKRVQEHGGKSMSFTVSTDVPAPFHSTKFDLQEKDILNGVKFECAACLHLMGLLP